MAPTIVQTAVPKSSSYSTIIPPNAAPAPRRRPARRPVLTPAELADAVARNEQMLDGRIPLERIVFDDHDLRGLDLRGKCLTQFEFDGADFRRVALTGADLREAWLEKADFRGADLTDVDLSGARANGADFRGADLRGAYLREAQIAGAKLGGAILPNGMMLGEYREKEIRALLGARGRCVWSVLSFWNFHDWTNDPLCVALGVSSFDEIPEDLKERAVLFHALFDGGHLPRPRFPLPQIVRVAQ